MSNIIDFNKSLGRNPLSGSSITHTYSIQPDFALPEAIIRSDSLAEEGSSSLEGGMYSYRVIGMLDDFDYCDTNLTIRPKCPIGVRCEGHIYKKQWVNVEVFMDCDDCDETVIEFALEAILQEGRDLGFIDPYWAEMAGWPKVYFMGPVPTSLYLEYIGAPRLPGFPEPPQPIDLENKVELGRPIMIDGANSGQNLETSFPAEDKKSSLQALAGARQSRINTNNSIWTRQAKKKNTHISPNKKTKKKKK